ncbi:helix-turn-helix domain-containing protein [Gryllotalpicola koreensis]|uniref:helix-turn-helix transcriptional regulator n=1 Tax=Gryllotalpicola koreensis TaxID=993086 RepID=UPI0031D9AAEC
MLTLAVAVALLDGSAAPAIDVDDFADAFAAGGGTAEEVVQAASILFGLAVAHIGLTRANADKAIASAVNRAILTWLTPTMVAFGRRRPAITPSAASSDEAPPPRLTRREREVLTVLSKSPNSAAACAELTISAHTLRHHISHLCEKLKARNRFELLLIAQRHGLV